MIIGNPPYVEYSKIKKDYIIRGYQTESCGNLYAYVMELSLNLLKNKARFGMIVQLPIVCTDRMKPLQKQFYTKNEAVWFSSFDDRPARLFDGLEHIRATIAVSQKGNTKTNAVYSTNYNRWYSESRNNLFSSLSFTEISNQLMSSAIPKIGQHIPKTVIQSISKYSKLVNYLITISKNVVHFHNAPQYWVRAMDFAPYFWNERDGEQVSTQVKSLYLPSQLDASVVVASLNSSLFYWWFIILSDFRHLNLRDIENFPIALNSMSKSNKQELSELSANLMADLKSHAYRKECTYKATGKVVYDEFYPKKSKPIIDEIDHVLAKHYGFTDEELDFIINYDIKYRMGINAE